MQKHINSLVIALETGEHVQHSNQKTADSNQITSAVQQHSHYYNLIMSGCPATYPGNTLKQLNSEAGSLMWLDQTASLATRY